MQRRATRCVKGFRVLQYPARLQELQKPSMQRHILRATLITAYNLFYGNLSLLLEEFLYVPAVSHLRGHQFMVRQLDSNSCEGQPHLQFDWSVVEAPSLNLFKERLDNGRKNSLPDYTEFRLNTFITVYGFDMQVLFSSSVNSDS